MERGEISCAGLMLAGGAALALTAVALLFRARAFIINRAAGTVTVRDRQLLGTPKETTYPMEKMEVVLEWRQITHHYSTRGGRSSRTVVTEKIWMDPKGPDRIPFLKDVRGLAGQELAAQLALDLGCKWVRRGHAL